MLIKSIIGKFKNNLRLITLIGLLSFLLPILLINYFGFTQRIFAAPSPGKPTLQSPADNVWIKDNPTFTARVTHPAAITTHALFHWVKVDTDPAPPSDADGSIVAPPPGDSTWIDTAGFPDGIYDWQAKAIDADGLESSFSSFRRVKMDSTEPKVNFCGPITVSENRISLSFSSRDDPPPSYFDATPSGIANGDLQRLVQSGGGSGTWNTVSTAKDGSFFQIGQTGLSYSYRFRATDNAGNISQGGSYFSCGGVTLTKAWLKANGGDVGAVDSINPSKSVAKILSLQVLGPLDDAHQKDGGTGATNTSVKLQMDSNNSSPQRWNTGLRFNGVNIGRGDIIVSATLNLSVSSVDDDDPNIDIYAQNVDNADDFDPVKVNDHLPLTSSVSWVDNGVFTGNYVSSPDIKSVIQEVINRPLWTTGNSLALILKGKSDIDKVFGAESFDSGRLSPVLIIEYDDGTVSNADYLVIANKSISRFTSARDWLIKDYEDGGGLNLGFSGDIYTYLWDRFGEQNAVTHLTDGVIPDPTPNPTGIYAFPDKNQGVFGDFTFSDAPISGANEVVLFINGDMQIDFDLVLLPGKRVVFIVKQNVNVNQVVRNIDGFYVASGEFNTGTNSVTPPRAATDVGFFTSVTWDGVEKMAYYDEENGHLKIAVCTFFDCRRPITATVDPDPIDNHNVGLYPSIVIDPVSGFPMISYYDNGDATCDSTGECRLKFAKCDDPNCSGEDEYITVVEQFPVGKSTGKYTSMAIGEDELPVISYWNEDKTSLKVAKCTGDGDGDGITCNEMGDWDKNTIDDSGDVGEYTSITVCTDSTCPDHNPMISYYDATNKDLKFAKCDDPACSLPITVTTMVEPPGERIGEFTSIAVCNDSSCADHNPVISYFDNSNFRLKVAKCDGDTDGDTIPCNSPTDWQTNVVDGTPVSTNSVGPYTSITLDPTNGFPLVSYQGAGDGLCDSPGECATLVAKCNDLACSGGNEDIIEVAKIPSGKLGFWTSITMNLSTNFPIVTFYDPDNKDIWIVFQHTFGRHRPCSALPPLLPGDWNCLLIDGSPEGGNCPLCRLTVDGAVITGTGLLLGRTLGISNLDSPAVIVNYDPSYLYFFAKGSPNGLLAKQDRIFRELPP